MIRQLVDYTNFLTPANNMVGVVCFKRSIF